MKVTVRGSGVAAITTARLLKQAGLSPSRMTEPSGRAPAVMLSAQALALLRDVHGDPAMLADAPRITRRIVAWGSGDPVTVPHDGVIVSDDALLAALQQEHETVGVDEAADFTVHAGSLPMGVSLDVFGAREAVASGVSLRGGTPDDACWVEGLAEGWLFLMPSGRGRGWLLAFGASLEELLSQSRLVAPLIVGEGGRTSAFLAAPRIASQLAGEDWLACGTSALGFDPICGDGTAQAVREAVLASAVIRGIAEGGDRVALVDHYRAMLVAAMRRHLQLSAQFYAGGGTGDWWERQSRDLAEGHARLTRFLAGQRAPRFAIRGFTLVAREEAV